MTSHETTNMPDPDEFRKHSKLREREDVIDSLLGKGYAEGNQRNL
jgi:hypothetical protein